MKWNIFPICFIIELSLSLAPNEILILILGQPDTHHIGLARNLYTDIYQQSVILNRTNLIQVEIFHEIVDHPGYWTFLAALPSLVQSGKLSESIKWIVLCEDRSNVNVKKLVASLAQLSWKQDIYLGYPQYDKEATIIHHFAFFERPQWFPYPLIRSGLAFSAPLIKKLTKRVQDEKPTSEFFIDASHELSLFIWQNMRATTRSGNGGSGSDGKMMTTAISERTTTMTLENNKPKSRLDEEASTPVSLCRPSESCQNDDHTYDASDADHTHGNARINTELYKNSEHKLLMTTSPYFCRVRGPSCAIFAGTAKATCNRRSETTSNNGKNSSVAIEVDEIYFAIKTYHKFHTERIPIIEKTWGQYAVHKKYFSDVADDRIPTVAVNIPNTDSGHCAKTLSIFKLALKDIDTRNRNNVRQMTRQIKWIFLCDDDTLLSVSRICDILECFNATEHVYLGERYGYRLHSKDGFNYITGGGGMAISLPTARKIVNLCACPSASSPDDMIIGMCLQRLGIKATHSSRFHQARPVDYSTELLSLDEPISFHKFWQIDPIRTYAKWFGMVDAARRSNQTKSKRNFCDIKTTSSQSTNCAKESKSNGVAPKKTETHHIEL